MPNSAQLRSQRLDLLAAERVGDRAAVGVPSVGTLWSSVATVQVGAAHRAAGQPQAVERLRAT